MIFMFCRLNKNYIRVIRCDTLEKAKWYVASIGRMGYNLCIQHDENDQKYDVCVLHSTCGYITLDELLKDLLALGYDESEIIA